jgi:hypothetical protein
MISCGENLIPRKVILPNMPKRKRIAGKKELLAVTTRDGWDNEGRRFRSVPDATNY